MAYFSSTYLDDIKPILLDWLTNSGSSKNVADLPLSLANRAQKNLWSKKPWSGLVTRISLSLTSGYTFLPVDFGRIVDIYADLDGNGVGDYWLFDGDSYDRGYYIESLFSKEGGYVNKITFNYSQPASPQLRYQKMLDDFTGGATDEYSFFPAELILLEAQRINTLGKGNIKEWNALSNAFAEQYKDFCNTAQWVNQDNMPRVNDINGYQIQTETYSLGGNDVSRWNTHPNGYII